MMPKQGMQPWVVRDLGRLSKQVTKGMIAASPLRDELQVMM
jgi:hypothetical protein